MANFKIHPEAITYKSADQSVTSSTTLANDSDLFQALDSNTTYEFEARIIFGAVSTTPDLKSDWTVPAGAAGEWSFVAAWGAADAFVAPPSNAFGSSGEVLGASTADRIAYVHGRVVTAGTAGNLQFRWAQNTSSVDATTVRASSRLVVRRIL